MLLLNPSVIDALALTIVDIPIVAVTISAFSLFIYFIPHLQRSASQFL